MYHGITMPTKLFLDTVEDDGKFLERGDAKGRHHFSEAGRLSDAQNSGNMEIKPFETSLENFTGLREFGEVN
ncbi:MAG: hypothetical protein ACLSB9_33710 [Hydrogeniiclostridium mannosilyticum]